MQAMKAMKIAGAYLLLFVGALCFLTGCTPPGPAAMLKGESLLNRGEFPAAIRKLRQATELLAEDARSWNLLALAYHRSGKAKEAEQAYRKSLTLDSDFAVARYNLGCLLLENGKFAEAEEHFKRSENWANENPMIWVKRGTAQLGNEKLEEAEEFYKTALDQNSALPEAWNGLGLIHAKRNQPQKAWNSFSNAIMRDEKYAPAFLNQAVISQRQAMQSQVSDKQRRQNLLLAQSKYRRFLHWAPPSTLYDSVEELTKGIERTLRSPKPADSPAIAAETTKPPREEVHVSSPRPLAESEDVASVKTAESSAETNPPPIQEIAQVEEIATAEETSPSDVNSPPPQPLSDSQEADKIASLEKSTGENLRQPEKPNGLEADSIKNAESEGVLETAGDPEEEPTETADIAPKVDPAPTSVVFQETETKSSQSEPSTGLEEENPLDGQWRTVSVRRSGFGIPLGRIGRRLFGSSEASSKAEDSSLAALPESASAPTRETPPRQAEARRVAGTPYAYQSPSVPQAGDRQKALPHYQKGNREYLAGQISEAIVAYREAVATDPAFFEAYYNWGLSALRAEFTQDALQSYEWALAIRPSHRNARYNFALALKKGRHFNEAASELQTIIDDRSDDVDAHFELAKLYANQLGNAESARRHYKRVLELNPNHPQAVSIRYRLSAER